MIACLQLASKKKLMLTGYCTMTETPNDLTDSTCMNKHGCWRLHVALTVSGCDDDKAAHTEASLHQDVTLHTCMYAEPDKLACMPNHVCTSAAVHYNGIHFAITTSS